VIHVNKQVVSKFTEGPFLDLKEGCFLYHLNDETSYLMRAPGKALQNKKINEAKGNKRNGGIGPNHTEQANTGTLEGNHLGIC